jgi:hypothetical protein
MSRRVGWTDLPLRCPGCARRVKEQSVLLHGGALRCDRCARLYYAVLVPSVRLVWIAEVTPFEVQQLRAAALSAPDVIRRLGGAFPAEAA